MGWHKRGMGESGSSRTRWTIVLVAVLAGVLTGFQVGKAPVLIGDIRAELGLGLVGAGFYMSMLTMLTAVAGIFAGALADRVGRRRIVVLAALAMIFGNMAGALAGSAPLLLGSRLLEAVGFVGIVVAAPGLIVDAAKPADRERALTIWSIYMPAGFATMLALTVWLGGAGEAGATASTASANAANALGWRGIWWLNAGLAALYLALFLGVVRGLGGRPRRDLRPEGLRAVLSRRGPWLLGACFGCYTIMWHGVLSWLPSILREAGLGRTEAGYGVALVVAANMIGCLGAGPLLRSGTPRWLAMAAAALGLGLLSLLIYDDGLAPLTRLALAACFSALGGVIPAGALSGAGLHSPTPGEVGLTSGVIMQLTNTGSLLGAPLVAWAAALASGDFSAARWLILTAGLLGAAAALALRPVERRLQSG